jgi:serine/threonine protein kinase
VGPYRLLAKIGEGGMGVVHLAQRPDGSRVALKVLRPHVIGDDEARERLAREVASMRRVRSPRIAEVLDADPWGPTPYIATRYVPGLSLHQHVRQEGPVRGDDLRHLAAGLAEALLAVHAVGVLHRDIKPSNVLLEGRSPVLIDFGLARLAEDPRLTVTGWLLGTPGYLAPEILYGEDATVASDVHSWAATVVLAATGRPPYGRGPAMAIMDRVRRGEHDLDGVPPELLPFVISALSPDPQQRPSLPALLADLRPRPAASSLASPGRRDPQDVPTMPFALATAGTDDDATDVISAPPATRRLDLVPERPAAERPAAPPVQQAARVPYMQPAPPTTTAYSQADEPAPWQPPPGGLPRVQRGLVLAGLFALVAVGFAFAPYLALAALGVVTLAVQTWSWTQESAQDRVWRRGARRWYDGPLAVVSAPWYLLVATGGTLLLLLWATALAFLVGLGLLIFGLPVESHLLVMGAVLGFSAWWGPGARRLRTPTRRSVLVATRRPWSGWVAVGVVALAVAAPAFLLATQGVTWDPQPGPPWRPETMLGRLVG